MTLMQFGYRCYADDAATNFATPLGDENTGISINTGESFRLRVGVYHMKPELFSDGNGEQVLTSNGELLYVKVG